MSVRPLIPYDPLLCDFLGDLSSELRSSKEAAAYPDVMSFAFWCRKTNISKLKEEFEDGKTRLGLGLVLHITPSNVPINFAFSFAFGLMSGNANVVRTPSKLFPQIDVVCASIKRLFENKKYDEIKAMTAFVRYAQNDDITGAFSENCNARIIWGGDEAIRSIRRLPLPERGVDIAFADRYSFCMIDAPSVAGLGDEELKRLAENFYNDTYLMDQNACSSPHLIIWQGEKKEEAKEKFWSAVHRVTAEKYTFTEINAVDKYMLLCRNAIDFENIRSFKKHGNFVYRIAIDSLPENMDEMRGQCGYFYEYDGNEKNGIDRVINSKYQTLTYFGLDKNQLRDFVVNHRLSGVDRIIPIGQALDIGPIWDGYDIVKSLSRIIDVK